MTTPPSFLKSNLRFVLPLALVISFFSGLGYTIKKIDQLTRDIAALKDLTLAKTTSPVTCSVVESKPFPEPIVPPAPPHITYQLLTSDHTMYGIYLTRCQTRKGFEGFQTDMVTLNQDPGSPQKISDARALNRIKAGQIWWFPPYCKKLSPLDDPLASSLAKK